MEITVEFWNEMARQMLLVSSLLSGFSIAVMASLLVSDKNDKIMNRILKATTLSAGCFLVTVFSMVQIVMITTPGGIFKNISGSDLIMPRIIGIVSFMIGLFALSIMIALSGWTKSKKVGRFTTVIGILTLILILSTMIQVGV